MVVSMNMLDQFELGLAGTDDQNLGGAFYGFHDLMIVMLVLGLTTAADRAALAVEIAVWRGRAHHGFLNIIRADVHDMGFIVIEPDDCMVVRHNFPFWDVNKTLL